MPEKLVMYETMTWLDYGKAWLCVPQKYPMNFLLLNNVWTATFFLTLMNTTKLYSWCSVWVEKEGIQIVEQAIGSVWKMCQGIGQTFQFTNGEIHDLDIWHYEVNAKVH
jgi:hypothetical protein